MINYYLPTDEYVILILILTIITMINYYLPTEYVIPIFIIAIFYYQNMKSFTNAFNANDTNSKVWRSDHQHEKHYKQVRKCWEDKSVSVYIISNENDWKTCSAPVHFDSASGGATLKRFGFKNIDTRALISFSETFTFLLEVSSLIERTLIKSKWYSEQYSRYFIDKKQDIFRPSKEKKSHRPPPPEDPPPKKKKEKKERKEVKNSHHDNDFDRHHCHCLLIRNARKVEEKVIMNPERRGERGKRKRKRGEVKRKVIIW